MDQHQHRVRPVRIERTAQLALRGASPPGADYVRARRGLYVAVADWPAGEFEARHYARMQAVEASMCARPVFSHASAAVIWGIPVIGGFAAVHVMAASLRGRRSRRGIAWHNHVLRDDDVTECGGHLVTTLERTLWDLATGSPPAAALAALDVGIRPRLQSPLGGLFDGVPPEELRERFAARSPARGSRNAATLASFCDARSGSPGESLSRWNIHALGFPRPELQVPFPRDDGGVDIVDFDWPAHRTFGEFDGRGKYLRDEYTAGRSADQVVWEEKLREDRIRLHRPRAVRWDWSIAVSPERLRRRLTAAGLPIGREYRV